jgi:hypothetical protein
MTLGIRHALGLGLLLALMVEPPLLEPLLSAKAQQPKLAAMEAPHRSPSPLNQLVRQLVMQGPWAVATDPSSPAEQPD